MKIPTIHLNGTSPEALLTALWGAHDAVLTAERALAETAPNGRDYYPQGEDAILAAGAEHRARLAHLDAVRQDLSALIEGIAQQQRAGRRPS